MALRVAVLDLGTNTFNLVVAEQNSLESFHILHSSKLPVKLGEGGINHGKITPEAFQRGIDAVVKHNAIIKKLKAERVFAFGTSALRSAEKGKEFIKTIREDTGIEVQLISGDKEAELIYYGVRQTINMSDQKHLILDIGGGSNEFIIADGKKIYWKKSYKLGIARLLDQFKPSDPITQGEINSVISYLSEEIRDLISAVKEFGVRILIGASGSFETFEAMLRAEQEDFETETALLPKSVRINPAEFEKLYQKLIKSTTKEREQMKGLEPMRIEMIVLACLFVKFIIGKLGIDTLYQSNFSLKEGVIYQLIKNRDHEQDFSN